MITYSSSADDSRAWAVLCPTGGCWCSPTIVSPANQQYCVQPAQSILKLWVLGSIPFIRPTDAGLVHNSERASSTTGRVLSQPRSQVQGPPQVVARVAVRAIEVQQVKPCPRAGSSLRPAGDVDGDGPLGATVTARPKVRRLAASRRPCPWWPPSRHGSNSDLPTSPSSCR